MGSAIQVENVNKRYYLGGSRSGYTTVREVLAQRAARALGKVTERDQIWALRDVSFTVDQGETLGIVGHNGAGKTTLLKILSRITRPTSGVSRTRGRVGSLLDVGTGFHPELNARENIYLNGAILGMKRREIERRFDEIVDFSGLERFLETPLKRFSWGMWLRLAFGVAAHVDPDVMLVDEVLAVGDVRFRQKCLGKMSVLGREGRTIIFVSHDHGSIVDLCRRAIWFEEGEIHDDGPSEEIVSGYIKSAVGRSAVSTFESDPRKPVRLLSAAVTGEGGQELETPRRDEEFILQVRFVVSDPIPGLSIALTVENQAGVKLLHEDSATETGSVLTPGRLPQEYVARLTVPPVLPAGDYSAGCWIGSVYETVLEEPKLLGFRLWPRPDERNENLMRARLLQPPVKWDVRPIESGEAAGNSL
jgi:ABC-type polysaccharide/polyol phosphate transport system ATPase subunit